jgi:hypothetical protein
MTDAKLPRCLATAVRMGYPGIVAAASLDNGYTLEVALVRPGTLGDGWSFVSHHGCDPERPDQGSSGVETYDSREEAEAAFRKVAFDSSVDRILIQYCAAGLGKDGKPAFLHNDGTGLSFTRSHQSATLCDSATSAARLASKAAGMGTYYMADAMRLDSFGVARVTVETRRVALGPSDVARLREQDVEAPHGWAFFAADEGMTRFVPTADRPYAASTVDGAGRYPKLGSLLARIGDDKELRPYLGLRVPDTTPLPEKDLEALVEAEREAADRLREAPPDDLPPGEAFKPFG